MIPANPKSFLTGLFNRAVNAARADLVLSPHLPVSFKGRTVVVGAGKAAAAMAAVVDERMPGPVQGCVVVPYGAGMPAGRIEVLEAAHPVPDVSSVAAARALLLSVADLGPNDLVIALISGGGSSLLALPADGILLEDKQEITRALLNGGAPIGQINTVRKHLSKIKGGRLALAAYPAKVLTLAISDVPGDDPAMVASGPTVQDFSTAEVAVKILKSYAPNVPSRIFEALESRQAVMPQFDRRKFNGHEFRFVATPAMSLECAARNARDEGVTPYILSDTIEGDACEVAKPLAAIARHCAATSEPFPPPCVLLSGGETTVKVTGKGEGGRNTHFALSFAQEIDGAAGIYAISCDTDGIDGNSSAAGTFVSPDTLARGRNCGLDARTYLDNNDTARFFAQLGDTIITGPTQTNVNDFRAILILAAGE
jgi:glycerate 2-kinase